METRTFKTKEKAQEIITCRDKNGKDVIFINTGKGITVYYLKENTNTYESMFIDSVCRNIVVYHNNGSFHCSKDELTLIGIRSDGKAHGMYVELKLQKYGDIFYSDNVLKYPDGTPMEQPFLNVNTENQNFISASAYYDTGKKIYAAACKASYDKGIISHGRVKLGVNELPVAHAVYSYNAIDGNSLFYWSLHKQSSDYILYERSLKDALKSFPTKLPSNAKDIKILTTALKNSEATAFFTFKLNDYFCILQATHKKFELILNKKYINSQVKAIITAGNKFEYHFVLCNKEADSYILWHIVMDEDGNLLNESLIEKNVSVYHLSQYGNEVVVYYQGKDEVIYKYL